MSSVDTHPYARRVVVAAVCLIVGPVAGIWAALSLPNPPGSGPGAGQVFAGVAVPVLMAQLVTRAAGIRRRESSFWTLTALALELLFLVVLIAWAGAIDAN